MRRRIAALAALVLLVLAACGTKAADAGSVTDSAPETSLVSAPPAETPCLQTEAPERETAGEARYGNTAGNISNGAFAVQYGDDCYYAVPAEGWDSPMGELRKTDTDGGDGTAVYSGAMPACLNTDGEWIYYIDAIYGRIRRMRADGTQDAPLMSEDTASACGTVNTMALADGWIYFRGVIRDSGGVMKRIYKISAAGGEPEQLCELGSETAGFAVYDGWIYYSVRENGAWEARRMRTDGTDSTRIADARLYCVSAYEDRLYYISQDADSTPQIYSMNTDGTDNAPLPDGAGAVSLNVFGNRIYFADGTAVYSVRTDGAEETRLCDFPSGNSVDINVLDGWIYISGDGLGMQRMRTDGSGLQKIETELSVSQRGE